VTDVRDTTVAGPARGHPGAGVRPDGAHRQPARRGVTCTAGGWVLGDLELFDTHVPRHRGTRRRGRGLGGLPARPRSTPSPRRCTTRLRRADRGAGGHPPTSVSTSTPGRVRGGRGLRGRQPRRGEAPSSCAAHTPRPPPPGADLPRHGCPGRAHAVLRRVRPRPTSSPSGTCGGSSTSTRPRGGTSPNPLLSPGGPART